MDHPEAWVRKVAVHAAMKRAQRETIKQHLHRARAHLAQTMVREVSSDAD